MLQIFLATAVVGHHLVFSRTEIATGTTRRRDSMNDSQMNKRGLEERWFGTCQFSELDITPIEVRL